jgi:hypothetical protein
MLLLALGFTTMPEFQILSSRMTMWWCQVSPWGC